MFLENMIEAREDEAWRKKKEKREVSAASRAAVSRLTSTRGDGDGAALCVFFSSDVRVVLEVSFF